MSATRSRRLLGTLLALLVLGMAVPLRSVPPAGAATPIAPALTNGPDLATLTSCPEASLARAVTKRGAVVNGTSCEVGSDPPIDLPSGQTAGLSSGGYSDTLDGLGGTRLFSGTSGTLVISGTTLASGCGNGSNGAHGAPGKAGLTGTAGRSAAAVGAGKSGSPGSPGGGGIPGGNAEGGAEFVGFQGTLELDAVDGHVVQGGNGSAAASGCPGSAGRRGGAG